MVDLAEMIVNDYQANGRKSTHRIVDALGHLRKRIGMARAVDITSDRITTYITHRQGEGAAAATINRELAALKRAFTLALRAGKVVQRPYVAMLREDNRRKGFVEHDQYLAILEHLPADLKSAITTAYVTGSTSRRRFSARRSGTFEIERRAHNWKVADVIKEAFASMFFVHISRLNPIVS